MVHLLLVILDYRLILMDNQSFFDLQRKRPVQKLNKTL